MKEKFKIMLVDDDDMSLESLERALKRHGYDCDTFCDPLQAILAFEKAEYHVLLTDFRMPKLNGIELIKILRKHSPELEAIIFTGYYQEKHNELSMKLNISAYLSKPIDIGDLVNRLSKLNKNKLAKIRSNRKAI